MASRTSIEKSSQKIAKLFQKASEAIIALIALRAVSRKPIEEPVLALGVVKILDKLEKEAYPIIKEDITWHYASSVAEASNAVKQVTGEALIKGLTAQDYLNIDTMVRQTLSEYGESIKGAFNSSLKVMDEARKARVDALFSPEGLSQMNLKAVKKKIEEDIAKDFTGIVDKAGRRWGIDTYAEMLARTRMREISNDAMNQRLQMEGYDLVQVSNHNAECDLCEPWEGEILSISGKSIGQVVNGHRVRYTIDDAENAGLAHPNCKHRYLPYHPEIAQD